MSILYDLEGTETKILHELVDFPGKRVLEIGCGDGRLTHRFAANTTWVMAIDPDQDDIAKAKEQQTPGLYENIEFLAVGLENYILPKRSPLFEIAILSWSL